MKRVKAVSAILLVVLLLCTGCSSAQDKIIGKWQGSINLSQQLKDAISENVDEVSKYIDLDDFSIDIIMEFRNDNQAKIYVDKNSVKKALKKIKPELYKGLREYSEKILKDKGVTSSLEEILESQGISSFKKYFEGVFDIDSIADKFTSNGEISVGSYRIEDNRIYISDDSKEYIEFEFDSDGNLKITDIKGKGAETFSEDNLPITMKKVK